MTRSKYRCLQGRFIVLRDERNWEHFIHIPYRCTKKERYCSGCRTYRRAVLFAKLMERWQKNAHINEIAFWTLGTGLIDNAPNRTTIEEYWQLFRKLANKNTEWGPLFRVVESGSKGKRLHLHLLVQGYVHRDIVLKMWRGITGIEKPHVWLGRVRFEYDNIVRTLWYVSKYVTKEAGRYSWMGDFYGKYSKLKAEKQPNDPDWKFWMIIEGWDQMVQLSSFLSISTILA